MFGYSDRPVQSGTKSYTYCPGSLFSVDTLGLSNCSNFRLNNWGRADKVVKNNTAKIIILESPQLVTKLNNRDAKRNLIVL